ncbi:MAG: hypothetical protein ACREIR_13535 [Geminicoccaceae bacterium]
MAKLDDQALRERAARARASLEERMSSADLAAARAKVNELRGSAPAS